MNIDELKNKYIKIPQELKDMKRWVCYSLVEKSTGEITKVPINPITGKNARCNDENTWTFFNIAISGCVKYKCDGLGFMLGNSIFGIDLDNHPDKDGNVLSKEQFDNLSNEFISTLQSYTELSQSGKGIHILCKGILPEGRRRKGNVEIYDKDRFFVMTGNTSYNYPIINREKEIIPLWEKYVNDTKSDEYYSFSEYPINNYSNNTNIIELSDNEVLEKASSSKNSSLFISLMKGDTSSYRDDHSSADLALCTILAFWTNKNFNQIDRIFRKSGLMRDKWDQMRGETTYGNLTIRKAIECSNQSYISLKKEPIIEKKEINIIENATPTIMNIDEKGMPIFRIKTIYDKYPYTDTGNALRFYDYFGELFKWNVTDKVFMFWTGKCWIKDIGEIIIRKYANEFINILKSEKKQLMQELKNIDENANEKELKEIIEASQKNINRVSNSSGKDAMIKELKALNDIAIESSKFDMDKYLLNTDSGIVNLKTCEIIPFDSNLLQSKSTNIKVSYDDPQLWIKFLKDIFFRGEDKEKETQEIIECIQKCIGYTLCGSTREQIMFLLYGNGSNGKSTFTEVIGKIMGDYGDSISSDILIQQRTPNNSAIYSLAKLQGKRYLETGETEEGAKLAESLVKRITGGDLITAQFKFGNEFSYKPNFKLWMSTNNKPIIRGTDLGIWRRIFPFPFLRSFTEKEKNKDLPEQLEQELPMILGWAIKGFQQYQKDGGIDMPECLKPEYKAYKIKMDIITQFIEKNCTIIPNYHTKIQTLFKNYKDWAKDEADYVMKASKFEEEMVKKGFDIVTINEDKYYKNIKLKIDKTTAYVFDDFDGSEEEQND